MDVREYLTCHGINFFLSPKEKTLRSETVVQNISNLDHYAKKSTAAIFDNKHNQSRHFS